MKKLFTLLLFAFTLNSFAFKVVGYLPTYRFATFNAIDYSKLTHVCVSFANPGIDGEFSMSVNPAPVISKAHSEGCEVFLSFGGGGLSAFVEGIYEEETKAENRTEFVQKLMNYARELNVDGLDCDLEGDMVRMSTYDDFVIELIDSAHAAGMEVSCAVAKWTGSSMSNSTVAAFDFINTMSYDKTGPWSGPGQHSPMSQAVSEFSYWQGKTADKSNLVIGLPFYGYEFKSGETPAWTWDQIVNTYPDSLYQDEINTGDGILYYNGITTIQEKVAYAKENGAGGVMIWELGQDDFGSHSLLKVIDDEIKGVSSVAGVDELDVKVYPNPASNEVFIDLEGVYSYQIMSLNGKVVSVGNDVTTNSIDLSSLNSGVYFLQLNQKSEVATVKLVKK